MTDIMLGQLLHRPTIDPISGSSPLPVQLSGSRTQLDTVLNAASVGAGGSTGTINIPTNGATDLLIGVSIDQQPWDVRIGNQPWSNVVSGTLRAFPDTSAVQTATFPANYPRTFMIYQGLSGPVTAPADAIALQLLPDNLNIAIYNTSASTATVSVRVWRRWR